MTQAGQPTFCGDGIVQASNEACDDGNALTCGTCSDDCQQITSAAATGSITVMKANDFDE
ncbi:DUF4215 domain-containing protein, partial [Salmonella enterica]|uniref:DUF4215 domain-containing protein n=1 Tax=Salmonella enterica TaxID=28901 RepID=UPI003D2D4372